MGGTVRSGLQLKVAGNRFGAGAASRAARSRHTARAWKLVGRPAYLPASVPLGLSAC